MSRREERVPESGQEHTGFVEGVATILTAVIFIATYWFQSQDGYPEAATRGMFLAGSLVLCGIVVYGALIRNYLPYVSHMIVTGAGLIAISQINAFLAKLPAFQTLPVIGPEGWGYLVHHDDMLLYPGIIIMLGGFYLSILHAARLRRQLIREGEAKARALQRSEETAAILERRVAFENLATTISTRFINLDLDEIDGEIEGSLEELGRFVNVDRAYITFSKFDGIDAGENFEWCAPGVASFKNSMQGMPSEDFAWGIGALRSGESISVERLDELPPEAAFEKSWFLGQGIKSVLNVPIISDHSLRGFIGFDSVTHESVWSEETEPLLRMIGEILLSARDRRCAGEQRQALENQVNQARKLESLGVMAGGIAHDFNNLLTGIMGNAELAQLEAAPGSDSVRYLEGVVQSARRAAELCRQMLAYAGRGKFVTQPVDLNELTRELTPFLTSTISAKVDLLFELGEGLPLVDGDVSQFRQLLGNLVSNASESFEGEGGAVYVRTGTRSCSADYFRSTYLADPMDAGDYVVLEVEDTGSGMPPEVKEKIFEPFFTTRFAGRGLGMPAVLGIVRGHNGALHIESEVGRGTRVTVLIPADVKSADPGIIPGEAHGDWHGCGTILLADDEKLVLSVGSMMLRHLGLGVVTAINGEEVLAAAQTHAASLQCAIVDYEIPGSDVKAVCTQLHALSPGLPVIVASGHAESDVMREFEGLAVAAFLPKPFELSKLQDVLRGLVVPSSERG